MSRNFKELLSLENTFGKFLQLILMIYALFCMLYFCDKEVYLSSRSQRNRKCVLKDLPPPVFLISIFQVHFRTLVKKKMSFGLPGQPQAYFLSFLPSVLLEKLWGPRAIL